VEAVTLDHMGSGHLGQSVPALGADTLHAAYGLTGVGSTVAVLDTGVDSDHPDLADDLAAQHCFTDGDCAPYDSNEGTSAEDEHGHGTNVAGIVTARGVVSAPGFAPDAKIVAIRVLDHNNWGWLSDWVAGLDWILANQATLHVDVVNMSLGTWALYEGTCDGTWPLLAAALAQLRAQNIPVFVSSGNQGSTTSLPAPACTSDAVAVGATYDGDLGRQPPSSTYQGWFGGNWPSCYDASTSLTTIACFSNSNALLDLLAPGARLTAPGLGGGLSTYYGTSQAAPTVAGIAALLRQAEPALPVPTLLEALSTSGPLLVDPRSGQRVPQVNALAALAPYLPVAPASLTLLGPHLTGTGAPTVFTATVHPPTSTAPFTYAWQATGHIPVTHVGEHSDRFTVHGPSPGSYQISVSAENERGAVSGQTTVTVDVVPPESLSLWLPPFGIPGVSSVLIATAKPVTVSQPLTFTWQIDGQPPLIRHGGRQDMIHITWQDAGWKHIAVSASNGLGNVSAAGDILIKEGVVFYLPQINLEASP
jgi:subtilisin family serine protease